MLLIDAAYILLACTWCRAEEDRARYPACCQILIEASVIGIDAYRLRIAAINLAVDDGVPVVAQVADQFIMDLRDVQRHRSWHDHA